MKLISWNINGVRAWKDKEGTLSFIKKENPDILCLQETKISHDKLPPHDNTLFETRQEHPLIPGYDYHFWNCAERKGYSGTALLSKEKPLSVSYGIGHELDKEGRVITAEFENYYVVTVYTPNAKSDLSRLMIRYKEWDVAFLKHLKKLEKKKPVIACGDLNVAHQEIDIARPQENKTTTTKPGTAGFTDQERERFSDFLKADLLDTYRLLYPEKVQYSWWSYRAFARERNVGWRIDYVLASKKLKDNIKDAIIYDNVTGSDHCPVGVILE